MITDYSYRGPPIDDGEILKLLPDELARLLGDTNGFIAFDGGLHVRGACLAPDWHALRRAWIGPAALYHAYPALHHTDIPFAEDALGDQFLLRGSAVYQLEAETGSLRSLGTDLTDFMSHAARDPIDYLALQPLLQFRAEGGRLEPGQLLSAYPPFCSAESNNGVSLRAIAAADRMGYLIALSSQIRDVPSGSKFTVRTTRSV